jgi:hypothetical protein
MSEKLALRESVSHSLEDLKAEIPAPVLSTFYSLNGTDRMLAFFLSWRKRGFSRGSRRTAFIEAGYAPAWVSKNAYKIAKHPAVLYLYYTLVDRDLAKVESLQNRLVDRLSTLIDSQDPHVALQAGKQIRELYEVRRVEAQKLASATAKAMERATSPKEISTEDLIGYLNEISAVLTERGVSISPVRLLPQEGKEFQ